mgnify:CR=1 FL=1
MSEFQEERQMEEERRNLEPGAEGVHGAEGKLQDRRKQGKAVEEMTR